LFHIEYNLHYGRPLTDDIDDLELRLYALYRYAETYGYLFPTRQEMQQQELNTLLKLLIMGLSTSKTPIEDVIGIEDRFNIRGHNKNADIDQI